MACPRLPQSALPTFTNTQTESNKLQNDMSANHISKDVSTLQQQHQDLDLLAAALKISSNGDGGDGGSSRSSMSIDASLSDSVLDCSFSSDSFSSEEMSLSSSSISSSLSSSPQISASRTEDEILVEQSSLSSSSSSPLSSSSLFPSSESSSASVSALSSSLSLSETKVSTSTTNIPEESSTTSTPTPTQVPTPTPTTTTTRNTSNNSGRATRANYCLISPRMSTSLLADIEYSVHECPRRLARDLTTVFPGTDLKGMLVVPTMQKCQYEMVAWDAEIAKEKDDRLDKFINWAKAIHEGLDNLGYWSDMTDPASGYPCFGERGRDVYPDVEGCQLLLKYEFQNAGCCKILMHPQWGSKIYPATFFTTAPVEAFEKVLRQVEQDHTL